MRQHNNTKAAIPPGIMEGKLGCHIWIAKIQVSTRWQQKDFFPLASGPLGHHSLLPDLGKSHDCLTIPVISFMFVLCSA